MRHCYISIGDHLMQARSDLYHGRTQIHASITWSFTRHASWLWTLNVKWNWLVLDWLLAYCGFWCIWCFKWLLVTKAIIIRIWEMRNMFLQTRKQTNLVVVFTLFSQASAIGFAWQLCFDAVLRVFLINRCNCQLYELNYWTINNKKKIEINIPLTVLYLNTNKRCLRAVINSQ